MASSSDKGNINCEYSKIECFVFKKKALIDKYYEKFERLDEEAYKSIDESERILKMQRADIHSQYLRQKCTLLRKRAKILKNLIRQYISRWKGKKQYSDQLFDYGIDFVPLEFGDDETLYDAYLHDRSELRKQCNVHIAKLQVQRNILYEKIDSDLRIFKDFRKHLEQREKERDQVYDELLKNEFKKFDIKWTESNESFDDVILENLTIRDMLPKSIQENIILSLLNEHDNSENEEISLIEPTQDDLDKAETISWKSSRPNSTTPYDDDNLFDQVWG